mgnify:CR=1 FL=1
MKKLSSVLSAAVIVLIVLIALELALSLMNAGKLAGGKNSQGALAYNGEVVQLDYLYADWCGYCNDTTPQVKSVAYSLGDALKLNMYNEAARKTDQKTMQIYSDYKERGLFVAFPTIVAKGKKGEAALVGKKSENEIMDWVCSQFETMPKECEKAEKSA